MTYGVWRWQPGDWNPVPALAGSGEQYDNNIPNNNNSDKTILVSYLPLYTTYRDTIHTTIPADQHHHTRTIYPYPARQ